VGSFVHEPYGQEAPRFASSARSSRRAARGSL
jgi:hypothetical protein